MIKKEIFGIVLALLIGLAVLCVPGNALMPEDHTSKYGGTLIQAIMGNPILPFVMTTSHLEHIAFGGIFNALVRHDFNLNPIPSLAESWEISPDGKTYTFHLVKNATFHDGEPLTSADVKYTIEEIFIPYHQEAGQVFKYLDHVETPDEYTVKIILTTVYPPLLTCLGPFHLSIYPKHLYEGTDFLTNPHTTTHPIGTGPFMFEEFIDGDHATLVRNPNYWRKGLPYLDKIITTIIPEEATMSMAILSHEVDYVPYEAPYASVANYEADPIIEWDAIKGKLGRPSSYIMFFNCRNPVLNNTNVRRAIVYAIDQDAMRDKAYLGGIIAPPYGPIPQMNLYEPAIEDPDLNPNYVYDPERAEKLLDDAGYKVDPETGYRFELDYAVSAARPERVRQGELMKEDLAKVGIKMNMLSYEHATCTSKVFVDHDFDMYACGMGAGPDPIIGVARYTTSSSIGQIPFTNGGAFSNATLDELWSEVEVTLDEAKRKELYSEIQKIMVYECGHAFYGVMSCVFTWNKKLIGLPVGPWEGSEPQDEVYWEPTSAITPGPISTLELYVAASMIISVVALVIAIYAVRKGGIGKTGREIAKPIRLYKLISS